jgi:hypothetical protein
MNPEKIEMGWQRKKIQMQRNAAGELFTKPSGLERITYGSSSF